MTLRECYEKLGGNYEMALERLMNDRLVERFALKFLDDPTFAQLTESLETGDKEVAFRAAHTLKGVTGNLSFDALTKVAVELTEMLRAGDFEAGKQFYPVVKQAYETTVAVLQEYKQSLAE